MTLKCDTETCHTKKVIKSGQENGSHIKTGDSLSSRSPTWSLQVLVKGWVGMRGRWGGEGGEKWKERERYVLLLKYGNLCDEKITFLYLHVNKQRLSQYHSDKLQREKNPWKQFLLRLKVFTGLYLCECSPVLICTANIKVFTINKPHLSVQDSTANQTCYV